MTTVYPEFYRLSPSFADDGVEQSANSGTVSGSSPQGGKKFTAYFIVPQYLTITTVNGTAVVDTQDLRPSSLAKVVPASRTVGNGVFAQVDPMASTPVIMTIEAGYTNFITDPNLNGAVSTAYFGLETSFYDNEFGNFTNTVSFLYNGLSLEVSDLRPTLSGGNYLPLAIQPGITFEDNNTATVNSDGSFFAPSILAISVPPSVVDKGAGFNYRLRIVKLDGYTGPVSVDVFLEDGSSQGSSYTYSTLTSPIGDMGLIELDFSSLNYQGGAFHLRVSAVPAAGSTDLGTPGNIQVYMYLAETSVARFWKDDTLAFETL